MTFEEQTQFLNRIANVFLGCLICCFAFLLLWFFLYSLAGDWSYSVNARWFANELTRRDFALVNYWGIAITKIVAIVFFLFPYISIKLVTRRK